MTDVNEKVQEEMDITRYISSRLTKSGFVLTYNKQPIGEIRWEDVSNVCLNKNTFFFRDNKIYMIRDHLKTLQYVENCDLGWC
ncbi:YusG family protein [Fictibacillus sp. WQ 8-8]|uniref:DUF2553 family protein n=1 Tax=Fictibacillus sp. WQ 8-8 TaxID=2938788 RepID=UPI00210BB442|nr:DUF2553 family protein [Fictibacillus sp. WQ 8-8]MCQ6267792.1 YusG family protein [Fictibacillus sp. WQ 8-8]